MKMLKHLSFPNHFEICTLQYAICTIFLLTLFSCGDSNHSPTTGSVSFGLSFDQTAALLSPKTAPTGDICVDYGITTITGKAQNSATGQVVIAGPWPCSAHAGKVDNIPSGSGYYVIAEGSVNGVVVWSGQKTGVDIIGGQDTGIGNIIMTYVGNDHTAPAVNSVTPINNATSVPVTSPVTVSFSEDMSATTIDATSFKLMKGGTLVSGSVSYDATTKKATFYPSYDLSYLTTHTATITTAVKDMAMNAVQATYSWSFVTEAAPVTTPAAPSNIQAVGGDKKVTISWTAASGATSYNLYYATSYANANKTMGTKISSITSPFVYTSSTNGTTYYYVVTAVNSFGESVASSPVVSATTGVVPGAPGSVTVTPGNTQNIVSWSTSTGATSYNIYWSTLSGVTKANGTKITGPNNPYTHLAVTNNMTYYYVVTAVNSFGESLESSPTVSATPSIAPGAPAGVTATPGNGQNIISWSTSTGATTYNIYWSTSSIVTKSTGTKIANVSSPYTHTGRTNGIMYYYVVTASNGAAESAESAQASATPVLSDVWLTMSTVGAPTARNTHSSVWTGSEMIIWGGFDGTTTLGSGARYNAITDTWIGATASTGAPAGRCNQTAVWTGTEMIIWGGYATCGSLATLVSDGYKYNPATDSWSAAIQVSLAPTARGNHVAVWSGTEMLIWGGYSSAGTSLQNGGRYNPTTNTWAPAGINTSGAPAARHEFSAVWTGNNMIIWGGASNAGGPYNDGGRYNAATDTWDTAPTLINAPSLRYCHTAVWTGNDMIIWGGYNGGYLNTGFKYNPTTNTWSTSAISVIGAPSNRNDTIAVWTGSQMLIWGGFNGSSHLNTGARYIPGGPTPPFVIATYPVANTPDMDVTKPITMTFNETMNGTTLNNTTITLKDSGNNAVTGTVSYTGTTVTFTPSASLANATTYTATAMTGAKDNEGYGLSADYTFTFTTAGAGGGIGFGW